MNDDMRMMRRKDTSAYIKEQYGVSVSPATLAKYAVFKEGPPYRLFGRVPYYTKADIDLWMEARLKPKLSEEFLTSA